MVAALVNNMLVCCFSMYIVPQSIRNMLVPASDVPFHTLNLLHLRREIRVFVFVNLFLPSATKLWQGNIFTSVCQEFCPHGRGCLPQYMLGYTPLDRHPSLGRPPGQTHPPGRHPPGQTPPGQITPRQTPLFPVHAGIDMTTASYWNAFLFHVTLVGLPEFLCKLTACNFCKIINYFLSK